MSTFIDFARAHGVDYDTLERRAREVCPPESSVHKVGSSLPSSYTKKQVVLATQFLTRNAQQ